jgi:carboxypeptidase C (cathepsin A)
LVPEGSPFLPRGYPQAIQKKFAVPYSRVEGGHMFPLEHPEQVAQVLKEIIREQR